jgi:hypothetical protein
LISNAFEIFNTYNLSHSFTIDVNINFTYDDFNSRSFDKDTITCNLLEIIPDQDQQNQDSTMKKRIFKLIGHFITV